MSRFGAANCWATCLYKISCVDYAPILANTNRIENPRVFSEVG